MDNFSIFHLLHTYHVILNTRKKVNCDSTYLLLVFGNLYRNKLKEKIYLFAFNLNQVNRRTPVLQFSNILLNSIMYW